MVTIWSKIHTRISLWIMWRFEKTFNWLGCINLCVCVAFFPFSMHFFYYFVLSSTFVMFIILNFIYISNSIEIEVLYVLLFMTLKSIYLFFYTRAHTHTKRCWLFFQFYSYLVVLSSWQVCMCTLYPQRYSVLVQHWFFVVVEKMNDVVFASE